VAATRYAVVRRTALGTVLLAVCAVALATKPSLRLERIDPSLFPAEGKIRVFASLVELEGQIDDGKGSPSFTLRVDGKKPIKPLAVEPFRSAAVPLDVVLVIESSALYGVQKLAAPSNVLPAPTKPTKKKGKQLPRPAKSEPKILPSPQLAPPRLAPGELPLDHVKEALATLLETRSARTRVLVIDYGGDVNPHPPFRPAQTATGAFDEVSPDDESGDLRLVEAVQAALRELNRPRERAEGEAAPRRLIVVVSDGLNAQMDRKTFRALGDSAALAGVPIHSIAYSPSDDRGPLLNLGEISKRSNGTFRWAKSADDLKSQIETLGDELDKQYVLTFAPNVDKLDGHRYELECESLRSNALSYDTNGSVFSNSGLNERRSKVWVILEWIGGILVGLFLLYVLFAIVLRIATRRRGQPGAAAALVFESGVRNGDRVVLDPKRRVIIGKAGPVVVDDPAVSTRHAELAFDGRGWLITDLGSTNGTFVEGQRVDGPTYLQAGQVVQLGQTRLKFLV